MTDQPPFQTQLDGHPASVRDLAPLAFAGFAHFTAMQVRDGGVRGLDLHLARLRSASLELFGRALSDEEVLSCLHLAIAAGPDDQSLTATMFSRSGEFTPNGQRGDPAVLVRTGPPSNGPAGPLMLAAVRHERPLPAIKHVGEVSKTYYLRQAAKQGFDDAAFVDSSGRLSEATIWNLAFWDGEYVVWPEAAMLPGITMGVIRRQLERLGVPQRNGPITEKRLKGLGAAVMNSWTPAIPVSRIATVNLPVSETFIALLHQAYHAEPTVIL